MSECCPRLHLSCLSFDRVSERYSFFSSGQEVDHKEKEMEKRCFLIPEDPKAKNHIQDTRNKRLSDRKEEPAGFLTLTDSSSTTFLDQQWRRLQTTYPVGSRDTLATTNTHTLTRKGIGLARDAQDMLV